MDYSKNMGSGLGARILSDRIQGIISAHQDASSVGTNLMRGLGVGVLIPTGFLLMREISKYQGVDLVNTFSDPVNTVPFMTLGAVAVAVVFKITKKTLEAYEKSFGEDEHADDREKEALAKLDRFGIKIEDSKSLAWSNGKVYMIREAGADQPLRVVGKATFRKFLEDNSQADKPLQTIYEKENSVLYTRSVAGSFEEGSNGEPSSISVKADKSNILGNFIVQKMWHNAGAMFKATTRIVNPRSNLDIEMAPGSVLSSKNTDGLKQQGDVEDYKPVSM